MAQPLAGPTPASRPGPQAPSAGPSPKQQISRGLASKTSGSAPGANEQTLNEISQWASRDQTRWEKRNQRFQVDQDMYRLQAGGDLTSSTRNAKDVLILNDPLVLIKKVARIIARHPNIIEIVPSRPDLQQVAQRIENWCYGWDQCINQRWMMGLNNPYRFDQAFYITLRGWLAERTVLNPQQPDQYSGYDPGAYYDHQVIDPANLYPFVAGGRVTRVNHIYNASVGELRMDPLFADADPNALGDADDNATLKITACYWQTSDGGWWHAVLAGSEWLKPPVELGYNPWTIVLANGAAYRATPWDDQEYLDQIGTGLLAEMSLNQNYLNKMATKLNALLSLEANPPVTYYSPDGKPKKISFEPGSRMFATAKDKMEVHRIGPQLGDYKLLWDILTERAERAGLPAAMFGQGGPESGLQSAVLLSAGKDVLFPFVEAINQADALKYRKALEIYRDFGPPAPLQARVLSPMGQAQLADITPQDIISQGVYVEVSRGDMTPQELAQKINLGLAMVKGNAISMRTFRGKEWVGVKNPDAENAQILAEQVYMNPKVIESLVPIALSDTGQQLMSALWSTIQSGMPAPGSSMQPGQQPGAPDPNQLQQGLPSQALPPGAAGNPFATQKVGPGGSGFNDIMAMLTGGASGGAGAGGQPPQQSILSSVQRFAPTGGPLG
jgi:hypothetical protein